jgi:TetR/AcrR family transcriptional repressor of mexCD-oprJ operon
MSMVRQQVTRAVPEGPLRSTAVSPADAARTAPARSTERTEAAILETATRVLAQRRDASMIDIANAAGVGRATLYRYFPTREQLLDALHAAATEELASRIEDANVAGTDFEEGLRRLLRAVLTVADHYVIFLGIPDPPVSAHDEATHRVETPVHALFERGIAEGALRAELDVRTYVQFFGAAVVAAVESELPRTAGVEDAAALVTSVFLDGARSR